MNNETAITCIVPVYNSEAYLGDSLESILNQTLIQHLGRARIQILLVDDASTDHSLELLQKYEKKYPDMISVLHREENGRPGAARNLALEFAKGRYVIFLDSDDYIEPEMLEKLYDEACTHLEADIIDCGVYWEREQRALITTREADCGSLNAEKRSNLILDLGFQCTKLFRREFLEQNHLRFREQAILEDNDFLAEAYARASFVSRIPEVLYLYHDTPNSLSDKDNITEFLESGLATARAIHDRVSVVPGYESFSNSVDYLILDIIYRNVISNIDELYQAHLIDDSFYDKVHHTIHTYLHYCVCTIPEENPFVLQRMDEAERSALNSLWNLA